jgi:HAE1 family hydrophobic/amphiphilic exporter-1
VNLNPSVAITIQKQSDGNTVKVVDQVKLALEDMTGKPYTDESKEKYKKLGSQWSTGVPALLPSDYEINISMDQSTFIKDTLNDVYASLTEGAFLAVLIVFLFLHSLRGTFIVALAIPTSMIATFMIMNGLGFTLNMMSMMGLSLSVGILVDDSIVVLENIHRHLMMGESPHDAALNGRAEIGLAAMAITMVDVVVFIPIAFMGGIVGQFFRQFGITVATATLFSLFMSFTLTPMLASRWLKSKDEEEMEEEIENVKPGLFKKFVNGWERMYGAIDHTYRKVLDWALDHRPAVISIGIMTLLASITTALPKPDGEQFLKLGPVLLIAVGIVWLIWYGVSALHKAPRWLLSIFIAIPMTLILMIGIQGVASKLMKVSVPYMTAWGLMISLVIIAVNLCRKIPNDNREIQSGGAVKPMLVVFALWTLVSLFPGKFGFEFQPKVDKRQLQILIEREVGASLETTNKNAYLIEEALTDKNQYPETKTVFTTVGSSSGSVMSSGSNGADQAQIDVELKSNDDYGIGNFEKFFMNMGLVKKNFRSTDEVIRQISKQFENVPGAKIKVQETAGMGGGGAPITIEVSGINTQAALFAAEQIKQVVKDTPGTYAVDLSWRQGRPELQAIINRDRAAQYGITTAQISSALRTNMEGDSNLKYRENGKEYDIRISLPEDQRNSTSQLANMVVGTKANGTPVRLYEVAQTINATGPTKIERVDRLRAVTVNGYLYKGFQLGNVQGKIKAKVKKLEDEGKIKLQGVTVAWAGQARNMADSAKNMFEAFGLAVVLVFMLMAALFESLISPLIVMLAVPQAMAGGLFGLILTNKSLSIITMIGFIMLISLVTKNAILLVDYTNTLRRDHGMDRKSALKQAGPTRLRPILMTTLAMIFGMMPTAVALANGSEMRQPMAIVVIGGLFLSMFLTLLMVPVFYDIVDEIGMKFAKLKQKLLEMLKAK